MWKSKKTLFLIIVCLVIVGTEGKLYMDKREEKSEQELLVVEKQSVKALKNTFADIAEVKIEQTGYNSMTGSYRMLVTMTNTEGKSVYFSYGFWKEQNELGAYGLMDEFIQKEGLTSSKVKVIYSNGSEGIL
ncbi:hypothetical protein [Enterococcus rivorum]|uniref:DUF1310 domain-containing protein n=1 Tax=Enterococcus rivorum TaxID=762845 RepID=A0A1E5KZ05_9ENTE|nr:hypothetical protein [Enterococcus rivorum]MBP2097655.1 hypothetical protein [Enterococcus rivorum]OEH83095.1 hypothetical protein BCR26_02165 [Enterococcus rivorum]